MMSNNEISMSELMKQLDINNKNMARLMLIVRDMQDNISALAANQNHLYSILLTEEEVDNYKYEAIFLDKNREEVESMPFNTKQEAEDYVNKLEDSYEGSFKIQRIK